MASKDSGYWIVTFLLVFLVIQGHHCKSFSGKMLNKGISGNVTEKTNGKANICKTSLDDNWNERFKDILVNITAKIFPFKGKQYNESLHETWNDRLKDVISNLTSQASPIEGPVCNVSLDEKWNDRMKNVLVFAMGNSQSPNAVNIHQLSESGSWSNTLKDILVTITGLIPPIEGIPVGKIISGLLKAFWPESKPDIWSLLKDQIGRLIDQKILEYELQERQNELTNLQRTMEMYVNAGIKEKGSFMSTMIFGCNELFLKLTRSKNSMNFIQFVLTHSVQHLTILKERILHGKDMYGEDNTEIWTNDLKKQISEYKEFFEKFYLKWLEWRKSQITIGYGVHVIPLRDPPFYYYMPYGGASDALTKESALFIYQKMPGPYYKEYFKEICEEVQNKMFGAAIAEFLQTLVTTFYLDNYIPGNEDNPSVIPASMSIASFGPLSPSVQLIRDENVKVYKPGNDNTRNGNVLQINVWEDDILNGLQIIYNTHTGQFVGNQAGTKHEIKLDDRRAKTLTFCANQCDMAAVTIDFSNGESTGRLGNRDGGSINCVRTGGIDTYGLYNVRMAAGGCKSGLYQIGLDFKAYPTRPSQIDQHDLHLIDYTNLKYKSVLDK